ncbi:hypothetical protein K227x_04350 [Rubripirellula lacrimiformis]|uniref:Uncharacterized protein n=1 Tax=Rubripirellula lacrimiformis TaxID=1930273 RepID=A0A517N4K7_9BACT|nr:hypothetical protein [Rubripirellula lacrimiformis]QDT02064.1 hypothetical protein K227x_04350 [Rubripirellula lacrimiformis]
MKDTNPQVEEQLNKLAEIICESLNGKEAVVNDESEALLKSLLMSGYARQEGVSLQVDLEARVKDACREPTMNRGGELSAITGKLLQKFNDLKRWESRQPDDQDKPKAANISAATDA